MNPRMARVYCIEAAFGNSSVGEFSTLLSLPAFLGLEADSDSILIILGLETAELKQKQKPRSVHREGCINETFAHISLGVALTPPNHQLRFSAPEYTWDMKRNADPYPSHPHPSWTVIAPSREPLEQWRIVEIPSFKLLSSPGKTGKVPNNLPRV